MAFVGVARGWALLFVCVVGCNGGSATSLEPSGPVADAVLTAVPGGGPRMALAGPPKWFMDRSVRVALDDGRMLLIGGQDPAEGLDMPRSWSREVHAWSPSTKAWSALPSLPVEMRVDFALRLHDGIVLAGGQTASSSCGGPSVAPSPPPVGSTWYLDFVSYRTCSALAWFDPKSDAWFVAVAGRLADWRRAVELADGRVLLLGKDGVELFRRGTTDVVGARRSTGWLDESFVATAIKAGALVIGAGSGDACLAEVYDASADRWSIVERGDHLCAPRCALALADGSALVAPRAGGPLSHFAKDGQPLAPVAMPPSYVVSAGAPLKDGRALLLGRDASVDSRAVHALVFGPSDHVRVAATFDADPWSFPTTLAGGDVVVLGTYLRPDETTDLGILSR